jgi:cell division protease FtsH
MVGVWGMSPAVGPIAILPEEGRGPFLPGASETSEHTQRLLDDEVHRLVEDAHAEVTALISGHRQQLEGLARALLAGETLDAPAAYAAAGLPQPVREEDSPNGAVPAAQQLPTG